MINPDYQSNPRMLVLEDHNQILGCLGLESRPRNRSSGPAVCSYRWLVMSSQAPTSGVEALAGYATAFVDAPCCFTSARVAATDDVAIRGLHRCGFRIACGEAVLMAECPESRPVDSASTKFTELHERHVPGAIDISQSCRNHNSLNLDSRLDPAASRSWAHHTLNRNLSDRRRGGLVAENESGKVIGFVLYSRLADRPTSSTPLRSAVNLDWICVAPDVYRTGLSEILVRNTLSSLNWTTGPAVARCLLDGSHSLHRLAMLRKLGFTLRLSILVMHRYVESGSESILHPDFLPWVRAPVTTVQPVA